MTANPGQSDRTCCDACGAPFRPGTKYFPDPVNGGVYHDTCIGGETGEGFVDADLNPLPADAPRPAPYIWSEP